jgi:RNA-directed DNA polymerase
LGSLPTPKSVWKLRTALHAKAKAAAGYRYYALYDKISREDILAHAYAQCRSNKGAPGVDGQDFVKSAPKSAPLSACNFARRMTR